MATNQWSDEMNAVLYKEARCLHVVPNYSLNVEIVRELARQYVRAKKIDFTTYMMVLRAYDDKYNSDGNHAALAIARCLYDLMKLEN